jgi:hypothetical protein
LALWFQGRKLKCEKIRQPMPADVKKLHDPLG